jgi:6-phosphogluconolactonase
MVQAGIIHSDGSISAVPGSPFGQGVGTPSTIQITADPQGRFVYVLNVEASAFGIPIGNPGITGLKINQQTGALTRIRTPISLPVRNDNLMTVDGTGHFLFEPNGLNGAPSSGFDVYAIDQGSGALTRTSSTSNAPPVGRFTIASADGRFLFNAGNGLVEAFLITPQTGQLVAAAGTPVSTGGSSGPMAASPDGKFLYVANQTEGTVEVFSIGVGGTLAPVAGSPFSIDSGPQFIKLSPDGKFLFVAAFAATANSSSQTVKGYSVNPSAGTFAPIAGAVVNNVDSITIDSSGRFAFISSSLAPALFTFGIDPASGALTLLSQVTAPASDDANDVIIVP